MSLSMILILAGLFLAYDYYRQYSTGNSLVFQYFPNLFNSTGGYASNVG